MTKSIVIFSAITALFLSACGTTSSSSGGTQTSINTVDIAVERGPVLDANVTDAKGKKGMAQGNGVYRFENPSYPVQSRGGYIDVDRDGKVSVGDVAMGNLTLKTKSGNVMTIATTLMDDKEGMMALMSDGYTQEQLMKKRPSTDKDIAALSDAIYKYAIENNVSDLSTLKLKEIPSLLNDISTRKSDYANRDDNATALEATLINTLASGATLSTLTDEDIAKMISLTLEQKKTLSLMWDEERLAYDIYTELYKLYPVNQLKNIPNNSEIKHIEAVRALIEKYDLNIFNTTDYSGGYDGDVLASYNITAEYETPVVASLYSELYAKGEKSRRDALEVGCMVEVQDINDLTESLEIVDGVEDITTTFELLRTQSYSHYNAFSQGLQMMEGVTDGCCSLGEEYCITQESSDTESGQGAGD